MNLLLTVHYSAEFHERAERRTRDGAISMAILVVVDASIARRLRTANRWNAWPPTASASIRRWSLDFKST